MNLVFYSGGEAEENLSLDKRLLSLKGKRPLTLTLIPAGSYFAEEYYQDIVEQYGPLGVSRILLFNIDQAFSEAFKRAVLRSDIIHLGGGNTFYFLKHLRRSGMLKELKEWVLGGGVLTGLSAGAIVMTKTIHTASFPDFDRDDNDENLKNLSAMGLVDFEVFPHYKNSRRYDKELMKYSLEKEGPIYALPDGSGIVLTDEELSFVGRSFCFLAGKKYSIHK
ncbi:MAG: hypothetical protein CME62_01535 [Halobacteriovoraceae bacterium]|nr:hypothetical protein [Halobacteriovoraceae bacterium]|tara:strand:- start:1198 stop:1863 length:666 start_codon:yes stop_codon:yes gene_type:complete